MMPTTSSRRALCFRTPSYTTDNDSNTRTLQQSLPPATTQKHRQQRKKKKKKDAFGRKADKRGGVPHSTNISEKSDTPPIDSTLACARNIVPAWVCGCTFDYS